MKLSAYTNSPAWRIVGHWKRFRISVRAEHSDRHRLGEVRGKVERLDVIIKQAVGDVADRPSSALITEGTKAAMTSRRSPALGPIVDNYLSPAS